MQRGTDKDVLYWGNAAVARTIDRCRMEKILRKSELRLRGYFGTIGVIRYRADRSYYLIISLSSLGIFLTSRWKRISVSCL